MNLDSKDSLNLLEVKQSDAEYESYKASINHHRKVDCIRLKDYSRENSIEEVDILKIDTQGSEPEVLEGTGSELLKKTKVVVCELMFYDLYTRRVSFTDIERFLLPAGFKLFDIPHISKNPMNGRVDWIDLIYINEEILRR